MLIRIAASRAPHTDNRLLDTVIDSAAAIRSTNDRTWHGLAATCYRECRRRDCCVRLASGGLFLQHANYPPLKGDMLTEQAQTLAKHA